MKANAGLWIDHREAVIVVLSEHGEVTTRIPSTVEKQLRRAGEPSQGSFEAQQAPADDSRQRAYTGHLARYYEEIVWYLREAGSILIFGPGEAKGELKKHFESDKTGVHAVAMETADKMTEPQIVAKVRQHFQDAPGPAGHQIHGASSKPHSNHQPTHPKSAPSEPEIIPTGDSDPRPSTQTS